MKYIFIIAAYFTISGCDRSMTASVNDNKVYNLSGICGNISCRAFYFSRDISFSMKFDRNTYRIYPNKINVTPFPAKDFSIRNLRLFNEDGQIQKDSLEIGNGKYLIISLTMESSSNSLSGRSLLILPCDFIQCNGVSLIQDTISIKL